MARFATIQCHSQGRLTPTAWQMPRSTLRARRRGAPWTAAPLQCGERRLRPPRGVRTRYTEGSPAHGGYDHCSCPVLIPRLGTRLCRPGRLVTSLLSRLCVTHSSIDSDCEHYLCSTTTGGGSKGVTRTDTVDQRASNDRWAQGTTPLRHLSTKGVTADAVTP